MYALARSKVISVQISQDVRKINAEFLMISKVSNGIIIKYAHKLFRSNAI